MAEPAAASNAASSDGDAGKDIDWTADELQALDNPRVNDLNATQVLSTARDMFVSPLPADQRNRAVTLVLPCRSGLLRLSGQALLPHWPRHQTTPMLSVTSGSYGSSRASKYVTPADRAGVLQLTTSDVQWSISEAAARLTTALEWRAANNVDAVRNRIVEENITPYQFPHRDELAPYVPHITHHGTDRVRSAWRLCLPPASHADTWLCDASGRQHADVSADGNGPACGCVECSSRALHRVVSV